MPYTGSVPDTVARPMDWQARAACRTAEPDLFFDPARVAEAKRTCFGCEALRDCQSWVMARERGMSTYARDDAVIAGLTPEERRNLDPTVPPPPPEPRQPAAKRKAGRRNRQGHGTRSCYRRGCRREECVAAARAYAQDLKARKAGGEPVTDTARKARTNDCPSANGYRRHQRLGERIDDGCRKAYAAYRAELKARAVRALWEQGLPDSEIAARLNIGTRGARLARERQGLAPNPRRPNAPRLKGQAP
ncbi:WhiB family transcriptional regulator [Streptomyces sp. NPDC055058]